MTGEPVRSPSLSSREDRVVPGSQGAAVVGGEAAHSVYSLKGEPKGFPNDLDVGCERNKGVRDDCKVLAISR